MNTTVEGSGPAGEPTTARATEPATVAPLEQRVSSLSGDRLCLECGYNLIGQPVLREPHYGLFIARCPECGSVAALQEYPSLGKWAGRFGTILAALSLVAMLAVAAWQVVFTAALSREFGVSTQYHVLLDLQRGYERWASDRFSNSGIVTPIETGFDRWVDEGGIDRLLAERGGWAGVLDEDTYYLLIPIVLVPMVFGIVWSIVLIHRGWLGRSIWMLVLVGIAAATLLPGVIDLLAADGTTPSSFVQRTLVGPLIAVGLVLCLAATFAGLALGRPVARGLVRLLLPPRLMGSLAWLWTIPGLDPPVPPKRL